MEKSTYKIKPEEGVNFYSIPLPSDYTFLSIDFDIWGINLNFIGSFQSSPLTKKMEIYLVGPYQTKPFAHLAYLGTYLSVDKSFKIEVFGLSEPHEKANINNSIESY